VQREHPLRKFDGLADRHLQDRRAQFDLLRDGRGNRQPAERIGEDPAASQRISQPDAIESRRFDCSSYVSDFRGRDRRAA
jgi:hypothetical protein